MEVQQLAIKRAYLNADLKEDNYMRQPDGYDDEIRRVGRLHKTLYDLISPVVNGIENSMRPWPNSA
jgi:hypothetical protein